MIEKFKIMIPAQRWYWNVIGTIFNGFVSVQWSNNHVKLSDYKIRRNIELKCTDQKISNQCIYMYLPLYLSIYHGVQSQATLIDIYTLYSVTVTILKALFGTLWVIGVGLHSLRSPPPQVCILYVLYVTTYFL